MTAPNWVFSLFAFIGFLLVCIPFPWHLEAWNTGTCLYMAWTALACLTQFINSIVWNGNAINWAPVWCDISAKIIVGTAVAIPAASLCINRRLYHIASVRSVTITKAEKRRAIMVDLAIGLGLPVLEMILHYIPQGHRFDIYEDIGCWPHTYDTWVAYLLVSTPPILIGIVSACYAFLSIRAFNQTRAQSKEMLSSYSNLTSSRYFRLMALAGTEIICTVPLASYSIYLNARDGAIRPWISWEDTHRGFSRVDQVPSILWRFDSTVETALELCRWLCVACAILFFLYFGFADEAKRNYRLALTSVAKRVGLSTASFGGSTGVGTSMSKGGVSSQSNTIPAFGKDKLDRKNSYDSFSDGTVSFNDAGGLLTVPASLNEKASFTTTGSNNTTLIPKKKKFGDEIFSPSFHYDSLALPDIGGILSDSESSSTGSELTSPVSIFSSSSASSISIPEPAVTRSEAVGGGADGASIRRASRVSFPQTQVVPVHAGTTLVDQEEPRRNSHDMV